MTTLARKISQVSRGNVLNLARTTAGIVANDSNTVTKRWTPGEIVDAAGDVKIRGHAVGQGKVDADINVVIQPNVIQLSMHAQLPAHRLVGNPSGVTANMMGIDLGPGLQFVGGTTLDTTAGQSADDAATNYIHERYGGGQF